MQAGFDALPLRKDFRKHLQRGLVRPRINVASASALNLTSGAPNTDDIAITGTAAISSIVVAPGRVLRVVAAGAFKLANGTAIITNNGSDINCTVGDTFVLRAIAPDTVEVLNYVKGATPAFHAWQGTVQGATVGAANQLIAFQNEEFDTGNRFNNTGGVVNGIPAFAFMPDVPGYYWVYGAATFNTPAPATFFALITFNAIERARGPWVQGSTVGKLFYFNGSTDYVQINCYASTSTNLYAVRENTYFGAYFVRPRMTLMIIALVQFVFAPLLLLFPIFPIAIQYERGGCWHLLLPIYVIGGLTDVWLNCTSLAIYTWDMPQRKEITFSQRLERLVLDQGWRGAVARPVARYLNFFDPTPPHVKVPEQS